MRPVMSQSHSSSDTGTGPAQPARTPSPSFHDRLTGSSALVPWVILGSSADDPAPSAEDARALLPALLGMLMPSLLLGRQPLRPAFSANREDPMRQNTAGRQAAGGPPDRPPAAPEPAAPEPIALAATCQEHPMQREAAVGRSGRNPDADATPRGRPLRAGPADPRRGGSAEGPTQQPTQRVGGRWQPPERLPGRQTAPTASASRMEHPMQRETAPTPSASRMEHPMQRETAPTASASRVEHPMQREASVQPAT